MVLISTAGSSHILFEVGACALISCACRLSRDGPSYPVVTASLLPLPIHRSQTSATRRPEPRRRSTTAWVTFIGTTFLQTPCKTRGRHSTAPEFARYSLEAGQSNDGARPASSSHTSVSNLAYTVHLVSRCRRLSTPPVSPLSTTLSTLQTTPTSSSWATTQS